MKTVTINTPIADQPITAPNVTLGLMRIEQKSDDEILDLLTTGRDEGINFVDLADIYGSTTHACEARFAEVARLTPTDRAELIIQTKCGIVTAADGGPYFDFSYEHIMASVAGSLAALRTDYIDILLLHRPDALVEPDEVARAFDELYAAGRVRAFGVSNHTPAQIELLQRSVKQPLAANQIQLSITHAPAVAQGLAMNMQGLDQSLSRDLGIIDYCRLHDIRLQAWSPFQAGFFDGPFLGSKHFQELNKVISRLAGKYDVPVEAIAVAWITRHPANIQVVLGTTTPSRVDAAAQGSDLPLTRAEWYELTRAAGYTIP